MSIRVTDFDPPFNEDEDTVRARFETDADPDMDIREGGHAQSLWEAMVSEVARTYNGMNDVLMMAYPMYAFGIYLDMTAFEYGVTRKAATKATGTVTVTGTAGTFVPLGTRFASPATSSEQNSVYFVTIEDMTIDGDGETDVAVEAETEGVDGNVAIGAISYVDSSISGLTSITNAAETTGGSDIEGDEDLRQRVLLEIMAPQAAGSSSDHERWMLAVDGVYSVTVVPQWDGPNTVKNVLLGENNAPVSQDVLDTAQELLTGEPVLTDPAAAPTPAVGAAGTLTGTFYYKVTFVDESGGETKGSVASASVSPTADEIDLSDIPLGPVGTAARRIYRSTSSGGTYYRVTSGDTIADNTTTTYTDDTASISANNQIPKVNNTTEYLGLAPIGQRVTVDTPSLTTIDVVATVSFESGYSLDGSGGTIALETLIEAALAEYINNLGPGDDVIYNHVLSTFFDVTGVFDVSSLTVDGGTSDITLPPEEVASLGTVTLT